LKQRIVADQLRRIGHFLDAEDLVQPTIGMLEPWHYRNQARFTVGRRFGELCFTYRGSHRLLRVDHCWIVQPRINQVLEALQGKLSIDAVPRRIHQLSIRVGANTGQLMVTPSLPEVPGVESGQPFLEEDLLGRRFRLQATSFFQVNTRREPRPLPDGLLQPHPPLLPPPAAGLSMADILALLVIDRLQPGADDVVVDAYSGVGTFALLLAPLVRQVVAIEEARTAVQDARHNAQDVPNVLFVESRTEDALPNLDALRGSAAGPSAQAHDVAARPDAVVLDPARVGCHPDVLRALLDLRPRRVVYVSCDPSTLARDLRVLVDGGYTLHHVQPLDMFPQTYHVESVSLLTI
jgi:23S rRNA (uracil1939-C5)-methyltransferase